jgi:predicted nuclease with TOPRIM domain
MNNPRRGLRAIRTIGKIMDFKKKRTASGAFLELASLANEKQRLHLEIESAQRRNHEIQTRLMEIGVKEDRLSCFLKEPSTEVICSSQGRQSEPETPHGYHSKTFDY